VVQRLGKKWQGMGMRIIKFGGLIAGILGLWRWSCTYSVEINAIKITYTVQITKGFDA